MNRVMDLTAQLVARVQRIEADEGPRPERQQMADDDYRQYTEQLLMELGDAPLRVFAYGSLMWKPEFEVISQSRATLEGWHRSFCMKIERWRGTRARPGLMMALDEGGTCDGIVYELPHDNYPAQLERLLVREMTNKPPTNVPMFLKVATGSQDINALAFTVSQTSFAYQAALPLPEVAGILAHAAGHWGSGAEYLFNTVTHLQQLGIQDDNLWELQERVAAEITAMP